MSVTPFLPEPQPFGFSAPLQPRREAGAPDALRAMEEEAARARAKEEAFARVYDRQRRKLLAYIAFALKGLGDIEDLLHDVMLRVWKHDLIAPCGTDEKCIESYFMVSVRRRVLDELRKDSRVRKGITRFAASLRRRISEADLTAQEAEALELERQVDRIILKLPPRCRDVYIARRIQNLSPQEAAQSLGMSVKTVGVHLTRALRFLHRELKALGYDDRPGARGAKKEDTP